MYGTIKDHLQKELQTIQENGLYKKERIITSPQGAEITVNGETVLNFCANNYLGLSSHPEVVQALKTLWIRMASECRRCVSFAGPKTFIKPSKRKLPISTARKTPFVRC